MKNTRRTQALLKLSLLSTLGAFAHSAKAQQGFDDYQSFSADPTELDEEVSQIFGRFFQMSINLGSNTFLGDLRDHNTSGAYFGARMIYYMDKTWASELSAGFSNHDTDYNTKSKAGEKLDLQMSTDLIPLGFGVRYGFDPETLPRGLSAMNPYLSSQAEFILRTEKVKGSPTLDGMEANERQRYGSGAVTTKTAFGMNVGGGIEFDVYRNRFLVGFDVRYHVISWPDATVRFGTEGRSGNLVSIMGTGTLNY